jgi:hypothetical protein
VVLATGTEVVRGRSSTHDRRHRIECDRRGDGGEQGGCTDQQPRDVATRLHEVVIVPDRHAEGVAGSPGIAAAPDDDSDPASDGASDVDANVGAIWSRSMRAISSA